MREANIRLKRTVWPRRRRTRLSAWSLLMLVSCLAYTLTWKWRWRVPPKLLAVSILHRVTTQKTLLFVVTPHESLRSNCVGIVYVVFLCGAVTTISTSIS
jgi:hypothetical protein